jgi:hypothetical protein
MYKKTLLFSDVWNLLKYKNHSAPSPEDLHSHLSAVQAEKQKQHLSDFYIGKSYLTITEESPV